MSGKTHAVAHYGKKGERKKLSWSYKKKKRVQKTTSRSQHVDYNTQSQNKEGRIIVRNLPFKATEQDVKQLYEPFGKIEEINLLKHPDGKPVGCGFIQFQRIEDASKAIFNTNKTEFLGRVINSSWAIPKSKFCEKFENASAQDIEQVDNTENTEEPAEKQDGDVENKEVVKKQKSAIKQNSRKLQKEKRRKKRARIIIRNLSFEVTEENLREHFSQYGTIEEVKLLTKGDGKNIGCAFVQFDLVQSAAKAIHYANLKPLLNRPIVVDWAVPKDKFNKQNVEDDKDAIEKIKEEVESASDTENKSSSKEKSKKGKSNNVELLSSSRELDSGDDGEVELKEENEEDDEGTEDERSNDSQGELDEKEENDIKEEEEEDDITVEEEGQDEDMIENDGEEECDDEEEQDAKRPRRESHDVAEGKTVFLKNVPFSVKNDELKKCMEQFGPVYYALVCIDPLTEHSKGTAFVKFRNVEDAEKCLSAGTELRMEDQILDPHKALERNEVENKANLKQRREKDSRNLYLVKEGVVIAGSPSAAGVSATDMAKRLRLEQWKSQILRNLNMFVARTRLVVHNLPPSVDDAKLRKIFERHSGPKAVIREARVMRDLRNIDAKGVGKSKEYGFVSFTTHEDALHALRNVNNNPNIFSANRRPIVAFSIENRIMVNAKQRRIEKSREHNPLWRDNKTKRKSEDTEKNRPAKKSRIEKTDISDEKPYAGMVGKPGEGKLRSKFSLKNQAILHNQAVKKEKKMKKSAKKLEIKKKEQARARKEVKVKQGSKVNPDDVHFNKLVNSYKSKLQSIELKKSKWYET